LYNKNKLIHQVQRDRIWADIRTYKEHLDKLVNGEMPFSTFDTALFYRCVKITIEETEMYEEWLKMDKKVRDSLTDTSAGGTLLKIYKENYNLRIILNNNATCAVKEKAMRDVRLSIWGGLLDDREDIVDMLANYPLLINNEQIILLFRCLSTILLELSLRDIEINSICEGY